MMWMTLFFFFFSSRRRHTRFDCDWSSDVCSSDLAAATALGATDLRVVVLHVLPNCIAPLLVQSSFSISFAILTEAALSFLGLGTQPPTPSWGIMLSTARGYLEQAPWLGAFPGLAIFLTVLGFNLLGDGIRDALDPRLTL